MKGVLADDHSAFVMQIVSTHHLHTGLVTLEVFHQDFLKSRRRKGSGVKFFKKLVLMLTSFPQKGLVWYLSPTKNTPMEL